ncbi:carboxypeptidase regulatory-like domain-containing protein [Rhizobium sp. TH2]|uniref:carboxypeptidase regulatory-like domain-containing protein n=1 Tax=Rhizobium sp. TH2 TaxID=2775403 RepID=UPI0021582E8C|nr:carboxypeptidase regulatory-like domain-containing protein [Rhizobium sp. TH2]UVC08972.1 carboxypeptidase regulatory-like domain-containing protein [Rhizobium sp. TH2]
MKLKAIGVVLLGCLAGCVATPKIDAVFDPNEAAFINQPGTATITGQAFMRRNDGVVVYAAGSEVRLLPKTKYADARIAALYRGTKFNNIVGAPKETDPRYFALSKTTKADGEGRFTFANIPDGSYYVVTTVTWMAGDWSQGGNIMETATVSGGEPVNVIMSGQ